MATAEGLPRCPQDCGGPIGRSYPESLTETQRSIRRLWGCDKAAARAMYTITCPHCDGSGVDLRTGARCEVCVRGEKALDRCPTSHVDASVSAMLRHYAHAEAGGFPAPGGLLEQAPSFLHACSVVSGEVARVRDEEHKVQKQKAEAARASKRVRG